MHYYEIAPTKIVRTGSDSFTYKSEQLLEVGQLVLIPVGKQTLTGLVIKRAVEPPYSTRNVTAALDIPPLPLPLLSTALWMSKYYATPLATVLQTILPRGLTKKRHKKISSPHSISRKRTHFLLNKDQQSAVKSLATLRGTAILHGVTGSGKTAVYIEHAKRCLNAGKSVIVLVPEIALTPQLIDDFSQDFQEIILTHSRQTEAERHQAWINALNSDKPRLVIGPRSALFLPLKSLGAIIIDEAHEPSFKQDQSPRYSALRVASVLANEHEALAIQGSATPLVSEYFLAKKTHSPIISLSKRAQSAKMPSVKLVDMTLRNNFVQHHFLSDALLKQITNNIEQKNQTLIFHNRRGSANTTLCTNCGWSADCPRCFVPFTLHTDKHKLICHICGNVASVPTSCPVCHQTDIVHKGIGTKLIESELAKIFPKAIIARFDGDNDAAQTLDKRYRELYDGSIDIIIGTQVVAKGLDLPHLRTVGIIQADAGLALPDFMARERTFQLLSQAVGRVGRTNAETSVVVQTYQPEDDTIRFGVAQNYEDFYASELAQRKKAHFPPFTHLLKLTCIYKTESVAIKNAQNFAKKIESEHPEVRIFSPTPAFYERQRDTYRWQIIVKSSTRAALLEILRQLPPTHWQYDLDPMSLL